MKLLERDMHKAISLLECYPYYNQFDSLYPFCNENIKELFSYFDVENKDCLSILGGSDQVLDLFLNGASSITAFDINSLTKYYFYLKKAALISDISLEEYVNFFCYEDFNYKGCNHMAFNEKTFNKICSNLESDSQFFWTTLFEQYPGSYIRKPISLFNYDEKSIDVLKYSIDYLNPKNYEKLKDIIRNKDIDFISSNINALPAHLSKTYDFMYFSNVLAYYNTIFGDNLNLTKEQNDLEKLKKFGSLLSYMSEYLNKDGYMLAGYLYLPSSKFSKNPLYNKEIRDNIFKNNTYKELYIKSMNYIYRMEKFDIKDPDQDVCLVMKK